MQGKDENLTFFVPLCHQYTVVLLFKYTVIAQVLSNSVINSVNKESITQILLQLC